MEVSPNSTTEPLNMYNYINNIFTNPAVFTGLFLIIIIAILLSLSLGKNPNQTTYSETDNSSTIYGTIGISLLILLIFLNGFQYYFGINFYASVKNLFNGETPEVDIQVVPEETYDTTKDVTPPPVPEDLIVKQVFNVPGNKYGYDDAKAICSAYGARLATYDELESAYNDGADWCNYGWSDGQMALFPTQKSKFAHLQKIKGHENDCGRPGINGGYIANPLVKFGVNCYGKKPKINQEEEHLMDVTSPYPVSKSDLEMEQRVNYWKGKIEDVLVSPFNSNRWSKI